MNDGKLWIVVTMLLATASWAVAQDAGHDWPNWRGPTYDGVSAETAWDTDWSDGQPEVLWKKDVGVGASTVSVVGDRVYTMGNQSNRDIVWCLDAKTGEVIWQQSYACRLDARMFEGGPGATPTVADGKVYTLSHDGKLNCFDADSGKPVWSVDIVDELGGKRPRWGFAGSPLVYDKLVIVDTGSPRGSTVALNKDTGKAVWTSGNQGAGYAAPIVLKMGGKDLIVSFKAEQLVAMEPKTGRQVWSVPWETSYDVNATPPVLVDDDKLFISTGYNRGCALVRITRGGAATLWENREMSTQLNAVVKHGDYVYGVTGNSGRGDLMCMRLSDGKVMWTQGGYGTGAVMLAGDYLIVTSEKGGKLAVAPASPDGFKPTGQMAGLYPNRSWVVPVLSHGRIFVKDNKGHLAAVSVKP